MKVAALAQLVEHIIRNDGVRCSSHLSGTRPSIPVTVTPRLYREDVPTTVKPTDRIQKWAAIPAVSVGGLFESPTAESATRGGSAAISATCNSMPETALHLDRSSVFRQDKVGATWKTGYMQPMANAKDSYWCRRRRVADYCRRQYSGIYSFLLVPGTSAFPCGDHDVALAAP